MLEAAPDQDFGVRQLVADLLRASAVWTDHKALTSQRTPKLFTTNPAKLPSKSFRLPLIGGQTIMARLQIGPLIKYLARFYWVDALF